MSRIPTQGHIERRQGRDARRSKFAHPRGAALPQWRCRGAVEAAGSPHARSKVRAKAEMSAILAGRPLWTV
jgi:hypothetical protein